MGLDATHWWVLDITLRTVCTFYDTQVGLDLTLRTVCTFCDTLVGLDLTLRTVCTFCDTLVGFRYNFTHSLYFL